MEKQINRDMQGKKGRQKRDWVHVIESHAIIDQEGFSLMDGLMSIS